jgi:hypothetical protein
VVLQERVAGHFPDAGTEMKLAGHVWDAAVVITRMRYKNRAVLGMVRSRFGGLRCTKLSSVCGAAFSLDMETGRKSSLQCGILLTKSECGP